MKNSSNGSRKGKLTKIVAFCKDTWTTNKKKTQESVKPPMKDL